MAFAWNEPEPMIDTNLRRVLHRVFFPNSKKTDEELYQFAKAMIPRGKGRVWNYAMLDLAAMKCTARNHASDCPLASLHGGVKEAPGKKSTVKFINTDRYARGRIIETLRGSRNGVSITRLVKKSERGKKKTMDLLEKLVKEGLVIKKSALYKLP
jgi:adenine-specific DNA glycosylase